MTLSPKTMTSKSSLFCRRVKIWRLGRLLALTSSAQTPTLPILGPVSSMLFSLDVVLLRRRLVDVVRDVVPRGPRAGNAPLSLAGPSDLGTEIRAGPAGATLSVLADKGGDLALSVEDDILVG